VPTVHWDFEVTLLFYQQLLQLLSSFAFPSQFVWQYLEVFFNFIDLSLIVLSCYFLRLPFFFFLLIGTAIIIDIFFEHILQFPHFFSFPSRARVVEPQVLLNQCGFHFNIIDFFLLNFNSPFSWFQVHSGLFYSLNPILELKIFPALIFPGWVDFISWHLQGYSQAFFLPRGFIFLPPPFLLLEPWNTISAEDPRFHCLTKIPLFKYHKKFHPSYLLIHSIFQQFQMFGNRSAWVFHSSKGSKLEPSASNMILFWYYLKQAKQVSSPMQTSEAVKYLN